MEILEPDLKKHFQDDSAVSDLVSSRGDANPDCSQVMKKGQRGQ